MSHPRRELDEHTPDMRRFFASFQKALDDAKGADAPPNQVWGSTKVLVTDGTAALPSNDQNQVLFQVTAPNGIPQAWIVQMAGSIQQPSATPIKTFPFAKFIVQFGSAGALETVEVDGFSDQFLMVFGNQVTVSCALDFVNAQKNLTMVPGDQYQFAKSMLMQASLSDSKGASTNAKRTFLLDRTTILPQTVNIPYAATGLIIRSNDPAWYHNPGGSQVVLLPFLNTTNAIDLYNPVALETAHNTGSYLTVPSLADVALVQPAAGPPTAPGFLEFDLRP